MVLPTGTVMYQAQEVAAVIADDRYIAADGVEAVEVGKMNQCKGVVDPFKAMEADARFYVQTRKVKQIITFGTGKPVMQKKPNKFLKMLMWLLKKKFTPLESMSAQSRLVAVLPLLTPQMGNLLYG
ncbi:MAG: hypothetical protein CM1200mP30_25270 [Pseudomonadota bacterium]|nr:MAG: hypothetical protein CM1200mP30_25270 [Pseudomonadota bacterium]